MAPNKVDEQLLKRLTKSLKNPKTIAELEAELSIGRRRVYRYLGKLASRGVPVHRVGLGYPTRYVISS
jgi:predicted transcriptional regulator